MVVTWEETVNMKLPETVKTKVERAVGEATPTVTSTTVEKVSPGEAVVWLVMETKLSKLLFLISRKTCPMFQFSSSMTPVPLMAYISKLSERAPMAGKLSCKMIWME